MIRAKNYEAVAKFVKVMTKILWPLFFPDTVYICCRALITGWTGQFLHSVNNHLVDNQLREYIQTALSELTPGFLLILISRNMVTFR